MNRRAFIATIPALPVAAVATPSAASIASAVQGVMAAVVPHHHPDYQVVRVKDLQALCDAAGVKWEAHWAYGGGR